MDGEGFIVGVFFPKIKKRFEKKKKKENMRLFFREETWVRKENFFKGLKKTDKSW